MATGAHSINFARPHPSPLTLQLPAPRPLPSACPALPLLQRQAQDIDERRKRYTQDQLLQRHAAFQRTMQVGGSEGRGGRG